MNKENSSQNKMTAVFVDKKIMRQHICNHLKDRTNYKINLFVIELDIYMPTYAFDLNDNVTVDRWNINTYSYVLLALCC